MTLGEEDVQRIEANIEKIREVLEQEQCPPKLPISKCKACSMFRPNLPHPTQPYHQFFARTWGEAVFVGIEFVGDIQTDVGRSHDFHRSREGKALCM